MSQFATSALVIGTPRFGPSANAAFDPRNSDATAISSLCVDMRDLPGVVDRPTGDGIEVLVQNRTDWGHLLQLPALRDKLGARGLRVARVIPCMALQHSRTAVPAPG